jgi:serpin B
MYRAFRMAGLLLLACQPLIAQEPGKAVGVRPLLLRRVPGRGGRSVTAQAREITGKKEVVMIRSASKFAFWAVMLGATAVGQAPQAGSEARSQAESRPGGATGRMTISFGLDLFKQLRSEPGNLFVSPYSISTALAMTYTGARGATAGQMAAVLHLDGASGAESVGADPKSVGAEFAKLASALAGSADQQTAFRIANAVWAESTYKLLPDFVERTQHDFAARLANLDFANAPEAARDTINRWVAERTANTIRDLLPAGAIKPNTRLVLTNAIHFKARWRAPFEPEHTGPDKFMLAEGAPVQAQFMHQTASCSYAETPDLQIIELPYRGQTITCVVLLPRKADGLAQLESALSAEQLDKWCRSLAAKEVEVALPRLEFSSRLDLKEPLRRLGMTDAFTDAADFSGMTGTKELYVDAVLHQAALRVDEAGTEAAAATAVKMEPKSAPPLNPVVFRADHPFVLLLRDARTGTILFIGRVVNPTGMATASQPAD